VPFTVPAGLASSCRRQESRGRWLAQLAEVVADLARRWSLRLGAPFEEGTCAWVAPAVMPGGEPAVLKVGMPHMEAMHETEGLRFWNGDPTVRLLAADEQFGAMLLERCEPGTFLRDLPESEQDVIIAGLLRRMWKAPPPALPFRPLATMIAHWADETMAEADRWADPGLVRAGLDLFDTLPHLESPNVLLATDLHACNVLRARREPWLVIDPKPFVGDPAYDATQHLFNCERMSSAPLEVIYRLADLLEIDRDRVRLWAFARAAAEPGFSRDAERVRLARALA
jgi:streptomycin 6-kinase